MLKLIKELKKRSNDGHKIGLYKCSCGENVEIMMSRVKHNYTKSCGCLKITKITTHGLYKNKNSITYTYKNMISRCYNKNNTHYKHYGERGIKVCDRWLGDNGIINFHKDMGDVPKNKSIDRINNNGNYCKKNCRWATTKEQSINKRSSHFLTYKSKTQTILEWAEEIGMEYATLLTRINKYNYTDEEAIEKPVKNKKKDLILLSKKNWKKNLPRQRNLQM